MSETDFSPEPRPPIVCRTATFFCDLSEEIFEECFPVWEQEICDHFPISKREPRWKFELEGFEQGLPKLKDTRPSMWVDVWHERELPESKGRNRVKIYPNEGNSRGGISFSLDGSPSLHPRVYPELKSLFSEFLPKFGKVFDVAGFSAVELNYENLIRSDFYPEFSTAEHRGIDLNLVLETHKSLQLPGHGFMLPYKHQMRCRASVDKPMEAHINIGVAEPLRDSEGRSDNRVNLLVDFMMRTFLETNGQGVTVDQAKDEMGDCHEKVLEFFRSTFTHKAQQVFGLVDGVDSAASHTT